MQSHLKKKVLSLLLLLLLLLSSSSLRFLKKLSPWPQFKWSPKSSTSYFPLHGNYFIEWKEPSIIWITRARLFKPLVSQSHFSYSHWTSQTSLIFLYDVNKGYPRLSLRFHLSGILQQVYSESNSYLFTKVAGVNLARENSQHLVILPIVSPPNEVWETRAEIPYWWRVTTQIRIVTRHQYRISALVSQTSFARETSGSVTNVGCFLRLGST